MVFIELFEVVSAVLLFTFLAFQLLIPLWKGTWLFPIFRPKVRKLQREIREATADYELHKERLESEWNLRKKETWLDELKKELKGEEKCDPDKSSQSSLA